MPKPLIQTTGRRKEAVARVRLRPGSGLVVINGRPVEQYFTMQTHVQRATEALRLGIARALVSLDDELRPQLKKAGLLVRDAREKERRKYGLKKARKAPQYSKR